VLIYLHFFVIFVYSAVQTTSVLCTSFEFICFIMLCVCLCLDRYVEKLAQNRPLMTDPLDIVKFVCKDFWDDVFLKKVLVTYSEYICTHLYLYLC
jgi:hypothetical protein